MRQNLAFKHIRKELFFIVLTGLIISSCRKESSETISEAKKSETSSGNASNGGNSHRLGMDYQEGKIVLGQRLNNPYDPTLMQNAKSKVQQRGITSVNPVNVRTTHLYVKFKPRNWDEYDDLKEDTTLELSDIPFDYEIIKNGNYYHDPSINDTLPTYQYATVPAGFTFNDTIPYEVISPLYIPEVDNSLTGATDQNENYVENLLNEAYKITGNDEDTIPITDLAERKYFPSGRIQIFDTRLRSIYGMEGLKVTARRWFIVYSAFCDRFGQYTMSKRFTRPCNYSAWFEHHRFFVKTSGVHWINGPKQTGPWNYTINDGMDRFVGHIFRAAYRYHYKDIQGLARPFRWLGRRTAYIAKDANKDWAGTNPIIFRNIKIARWKDGKTEYMSDEVFSTTIHETGHTSHAIQMNTIFQYIQVERKLQESWAIALEWVLTNLEYSEKGIPNYGNENYYPFNPPPPIYPNSYAYQYWNPDAQSDRYTPIYIDIIDNVNQSTQVYLPFGAGFVNDQVSGYSLAFIESEMLKHIYGLASLTRELKDHKPAGVTDAQIDLLISHFY